MSVIIHTDTRAKRGADGPIRSKSQIHLPVFDSKVAEERKVGMARSMSVIIHTDTRAKRGADGPIRSKSQIHLPVFDSKGGRQKAGKGGLQKIRSRGSNGNQQQRLTAKDLRSKSHGGLPDLGSKDMSPAKGSPTHAFGIVTGRGLTQSKSDNASVGKSIRKESSVYCKTIATSPVLDHVGNFSFILPHLEKQDSPYPLPRSVSYSIGASPLRLDDFPADKFRRWASEPILTSFQQDFPSLKLLSSLNSKPERPLTQAIHCKTAPSRLRSLFPSEASSKAVRSSSAQLPLPLSKPGQVCITIHPSHSLLNAEGFSATSTALRLAKPSLVLQHRHSETDSVSLSIAKRSLASAAQLSLSCPDFHILAV
eukprot:gb/GEZN01009570.1/.p1 GENE.gb/GEZN01009570.1/~~gb/GEZN01009570.1/.p1  ORF type:complete len:379 (+),score=37.60 gb/GEZN01009570.1/:37-1137(+)